LLLGMIGGWILLVGLLRVGSGDVFSSAIYDLSALAAGLYALPAPAAIVALTMGLAARTIRY